MKNVSRKDRSLLIKMGQDIGYETRDQLLKRRFLILYVLRFKFFFVYAVQLLVSGKA